MSVVTKTAPVVTTIDELRAVVREQRKAGKTIGCVPTMGYLHEGHVSLVRGAAQRSDFVVVTIFVNPTQFGPNEDLSAYPRDLQGDNEKAASAGADLIFAPDNAEVYAPDASVVVRETALSENYCGKGRPTHFAGVTLVVTKLFNMVQPDVAVFGEKDYQQLAIVRRLVRDLNFPVEIVGLPLVREPDGLAMSSRNAYLTAAEREQAVCISRGLLAAQVAAAEGDGDVEAIKKAVRAETAAAPLFSEEYLELVHSDTLEPLAKLESVGRLLTAGAIGKARLIDNIELRLGTH